MDCDNQPLSGHSFAFGAALDLSEQGKPIETAMLKADWQTHLQVMEH